MADQYLTRAVTAASPVPNNDLLQFADGLLTIKGVTIINNSGFTIGLYFNQQSPTSTPDVVIAAYQSQATSVAGLKSIAVGYSGVNSFAGQIYFHWTSDIIISFSAALPAPILTRVQAFTSYASGTPVQFTTGLSGESQVLNLTPGGPGASSLHTFFLTALVITGNDLARVLLGLSSRTEAPQTQPTDLLWRGNINFVPNVPFLCNTSTKVLSLLQVTIIALENFVAPLNIEANVSGYWQ